MSSAGIGLNPLYTSASEDEGRPSHSQSVQGPADSVTLDIAERSETDSPLPLPTAGVSSDGRNIDDAFVRTNSTEISRWSAAGLNHNTELLKAVIQVYLKSTLIPCGYLDKRANKIEKALRHADSGSSFYTRSRHHLRHNHTAIC